MYFAGWKPIQKGQYLGEKAGDWRATQHSPPKWTIIADTKEVTLKTGSHLK